MPWQSPPQAAYVSFAPFRMGTWWKGEHCSSQPPHTHSAPQCALSIHFIWLQSPAAICSWNPLQQMCTSLYGVIKNAFLLEKLSWLDSKVSLFLPSSCKWLVVQSVMKMQTFKARLNWLTSVRRAISALLSLLSTLKYWAIKPVNISHWEFVFFLSTALVSNWACLYQATWKLLLTSRSYNWLFMSPM